MNEKAKEARRAYKREWNRKNRDKVKAAQARYWERKAAAAVCAQSYFAARYAGMVSDRGRINRQGL